MKKLILALAVLVFSACSTIPNYRSLASKVVPSNVELVGTFTNGWGQTFVDRVFCSGTQLNSTDILTAGHCVAPDEVRQNGKIKVRLQNGKMYFATIVKFAFQEGPEFKDSALIRLDEAVLMNPAQLGDSDALAQGDVLAIVGNTFGELTHSFTIGVVSYVNRKLEFGIYTQTDALAGPGNSGGSVWNDRGELIGVLVRGGGGVSLALPLKIAFAELEAATPHTMEAQRTKKLSGKR